MKWRNKVRERGHIVTECIASYVCLSSSQDGIRMHVLMYVHACVQFALCTCKTAAVSSSDSSRV